MFFFAKNYQRMSGVESEVRIYTRMIDLMEKLVNKQEKVLVAANNTFVFFLYHDAKTQELVLKRKPVSAQEQEVARLGQLITENQ